jgi:hypothetical protein
VTKIIITTVEKGAKLLPFTKEMRPIFSNINKKKLNSNYYVEGIEKV